jgi:hypothetical protein
MMKIFDVNLMHFKLIGGIFDPAHMPQSATVEIFGIPADTRKRQAAYKTKRHAKRFMNVFFERNFSSEKMDNKNEEALKAKILMPALALIRFATFDDKNKLIGQTFIPMDHIISGYRFICLKNKCNQPLNACMLFAEIKVKDYIDPIYQCMCLKIYYLLFL